AVPVLPEQGRGRRGAAGAALRGDGPDVPREDGGARDGAAARAGARPRFADADVRAAQQQALETAARSAAARQAEGGAAPRAAVRRDPPPRPDAPRAESRPGRAADSGVSRRADRRGADPQHEPVSAARPQPQGVHAGARAPRDPLPRAGAEADPNLSVSQM